MHNLSVAVLTKHCLYRRIVCSVMAYKIMPFVIFFFQICFREIALHECEFCTCMYVYAGGKQKA